MEGMLLKSSVSLEIQIDAPYQSIIFVASVVGDIFILCGLMLSWTGLHHV